MFDLTPIRLCQTQMELLPYRIGAFLVSPEIRDALLSLIEEQERKIKAVRLATRQQWLQRLVERNDEKLKIAKLRAELFRKL